MSYFLAGSTDTPPTLFFVSIVHPAIIRASIENTIFPWFLFYIMSQSDRLLVDSGYQLAAFLCVIPLKLGLIFVHIPCTLYVVCHNLSID